MGASRPPLSIAGTTNLSPCLLTGAELTPLRSRPSPSARRAPHALALARTAPPPPSSLSHRPLRPPGARRAPRANEAVVFNQEEPQPQALAHTCQSRPAVDDELKVPESHSPGPPFQL